MAVYDTPQSVHMQKAISGKGGVPKKKANAKVTKAGGKKRARKTK